jgi:hypothetical protein
MSKTKWLKQQKCIVSQLWTQEFQDQDDSRVDFLWGTQEEYALYLSSGFCWLSGNLWWLLAHRNIATISSIIFTWSYVSVYYMSYCFMGILYFTSVIINVLASFLNYNKYLRSQFWRFQSMVDWPFCFWACARQHIMVGSMW